MYLNENYCRVKKKSKSTKDFDFFAERQGFEPWEGFHPQRFSRPPPSTTQPSLRIK